MKFKLNRQLFKFSIWLIDILKKNSMVLSYINQKQIIVDTKEMSNLILIKRDLNKRFSLVIPTLNGNTTLEHSDILYCEADSSYCLIITKNGRKICVSKNLKWVEERLPKHLFIRIHQTYVINRKMIEYIDYKKHASILLLKGIRIPISRSKRKMVKKILLV